MLLGARVLKDIPCVNELTERARALGHPALMRTLHTWLAGLLAPGALFAHSCASATEYTLDPRRTVVTFEMRSMGTLQRGEFRRTAGTVKLDSSQELGEIDIVIDARSLEARNAVTTQFVRGPSMLDTAAHPEIAYRAEHIIAGGIANRTGDVVGLSNVFVSHSDGQRLLAGCLAAVIDVFSTLPIVGYECGHPLAAMRDLGFDSLGPLSVWVKQNPTTAARPHPSFMS